jgi:hypothetical protein
LFRPKRVSLRTRTPHDPHLGVLDLRTREAGVFCSQASMPGIRQRVEPTVEFTRMPLADRCRRSSFDNHRWDPFLLWVARSKRFRRQARDNNGRDGLFHSSSVSAAQDGLSRHTRRERLANVKVCPVQSRLITVADSHRSSSFRILGLPLTDSPNHSLSIHSMLLSPSRTI